MARIGPVAHRMSTQAAPEDLQGARVPADAFEVDELPALRQSTWRQSGSQGELLRQNLKKTKKHRILLGIRAGRGLRVCRFCRPAKKSFQSLRVA
jgi:hypothetical protein